MVDQYKIHRTEQELIITFCCIIMIKSSLVEMAKMQKTSGRTFGVLPRTGQICNNINIRQMLE
jgi:hypothetical protein